MNRQFKEKPLGLSSDLTRDNFHISEGPTNPDMPVANHSNVSIPQQWLDPVAPTFKWPSIPFIVGFIVIALSSGYALIEACCLMCEAFLKAIR